MTESVSAIEAFAQRLQELHQAAGAPTGKAMENRANRRQPTVPFNQSSFSEWRRGKRTPGSLDTVHWLVEEYLRPLAKEKSPDTVIPPPDWWRDTWTKARAEANAGGRPPTSHPPAPAWQSPPLVQVGPIPPEADCFQHRAIADRLEQQATAVGTGVVCQVLAGTGGIGKTQLAAAYARSARQRGVQVLVWVTASTRAGVVDAYANAAVRLKLADRDDSDYAARVFLDWAATTDQRWLLVLDDVQAHGDLRGLWPPASPAGTTMVTTRRRDLSPPGLHPEVVEVGLFTGQEADAYLQHRLGGLAADPVQRAALISELGHLPLALAQAAAYMLQQDLDCGHYRQLLLGKLLADTVPEPDDLAEDQRIVSAVWDISVDRADQDRPRGLARPLMQLASVLDPNGIPTAVFTSSTVRDYLASHLPDPNDLTEQTIDQGLRLLHRYNLIEYNRAAAHHQVRVHQLIQRATRENLHSKPDDGPIHLAQISQTAADALLDAWPQIERDDRGQVLRANTSALQRAAGSALCTTDTGAHFVLFRAASSLGETGQPIAASTAYTNLHAICRQELGPDHLHTLGARGHLASWRGEAGDAAGAATAFEDLLADRMRVLGPDHPATLSARTNLAFWRGEAGDVNEAVTAFQRLLVEFLRVLGPDHPHTLSARSNLAMFQGKAGDSAGAAAAFEEHLTELLRVLGPDHPQTLTARNNLAACLGEAGDAAAAAAAFEEVLVEFLRVLGPDHPHTLTARGNLAAWRGKAGDTAGAATAAEELLADQLRVLGPDHPQTLATRNNLAFWREQVGDAAAFEEVLVESLRVLGPDHPHTLTLRGNLAVRRGEAGDAAGAATALEELLTDQLRVLGPDHPATLMTRGNLAFWRGEAGDAAGAATIFEELLVEFLRVLGPDHPHTLTLRGNLATCLGKAGDTAAAAAAFEELLAESLRVLGPDHSHTLATRDHMTYWKKAAKGAS
ncbi:tetratricopeptide repeat protein [Actinomadura violacea]|uniref:Tetratricopeptide repeat protein n=1 Tax=Actinomadura violacea TaxID=2819934 RepID=A0ABS3RMY6_9ACTN|nr:tetratricopeptide repeat protein [Actinomadura violacea]MBO2458115.1 tetratricopeptide repeat protein [Actinomadura violacea]